MPFRKMVVSVGVAVWMGASVPTLADGPAVEISPVVNATAGMMWGDDVSYLLDRSNGTKATLGNDLGWAGGGVALAVRPGSESLLSGSFLGERPTVRISGGYWKAQRDTARHSYDQPANAIVNIDGTNNNVNFLAATFSPEMRMEGGDLSFMIEGESSAGWSFAPQLGLLASLSHRDYNLRAQYSNGSDRQILVGDMKSVGGGIHLGVAMLTPEWSGWRLGLNPAMRVMAMQSTMRLKQDPYEVTGSLDTMTVDDRETHLFLNPSLGLSVIGNVGILRISAEVRGDYADGVANFHLPERTGDRSAVATGNVIGLSGGLTVSVSF